MQIIDSDSSVGITDWHGLLDYTEPEGALIDDLLKAVAKVFMHIEAAPQHFAGDVPILQLFCHVCFPRGLVTEYWRLRVPSLTLAAALVILQKWQSGYSRKGRENLPQSARIAGMNGRRPTGNHQASAQRWSVIATCRVSPLEWQKKPIARNSTSAQ